MAGTTLPTACQKTKPIILHQGMPTKVNITFVPEELQFFFLGFLGVEFDFQSIDTVGTIFGGNGQDWFSSYCSNYYYSNGAV